MPELMREPFEKPVTGNETEPQENSSQERNYWRDSKTRARARFFVYQTNVHVEISLKSFLCQRSQKDEERCSLRVPNKFNGKAN